MGKIPFDCVDKIFEDPYCDHVFQIEKLNTVEKWRWVPGYRGLYKASIQGRIKSFSMVKEGKILKQTETPSGYYIVGLSKNRITNTCRVNRIILLTFVGPCPEGMQGCHNNGNRKDNRLFNLRWDTPKSNYADRKKHGTYFVGEDSPVSILAEKEVLEIRKLFASGRFTQIELGKRYDVSHATIGEVIKGNVWKHVGGPIGANTRLSEQKIIAIREEYAYTNISQRDLAKKYGTSAPSVAQITTGQRWKHIGGPITRMLRFSEEEKQEVRKMYSTRKYSQRKLAEMFEISPATVNRIVRNK